VLVVIIKQYEEANSLVAYNGKSRIFDKKVNSGAKQSYGMLKSVLSSTIADAILLEALAVNQAKIETQRNSIIRVQKYYKLKVKLLGQRIYR